MSDEKRVGAAADVEEREAAEAAPESGARRERRTVDDCPGPPKGYKPFAIDFGTFVLSLSQSVLVNLGMLEDPEGNRSVNITLAKHTIDILGMLQDKTKGNLLPEEQKLLCSILCDLRIQFVQHANQANDGK